MPATAGCAAGEQNADAARAGGRPQPLPKSVDTNLKGRYQDDFELDESVRDEVAKVRRTRDSCAYACSGRCDVTLPA